jgi:hypothetical protein
MVAVVVAEAAVDRTVVQAVVAVVVMPIMTLESEFIQAALTSTVPDKVTMVGQDQLMCVVAVVVVLVPLEEP